MIHSLCFNNTLQILFPFCKTQTIKIAPLFGGFPLLPQCAASKGLITGTFGASGASEVPRGTGQLSAGRSVSHPALCVRAVFLFVFLVFRVRRVLRCPLNVGCCVVSFIFAEYITSVLGSYPLFVPSSPMLASKRAQWLGVVCSCRLPCPRAPGLSFDGQMGNTQPSNHQSISWELSGT